jgi:hypothetical protein
MDARAIAAGAGRSAASTLVTPLREHLGHRVVNWTPDFMRFGNHLYLWVWAYTGRDDPVERKVLMTEPMRYWAELVPDFSRRFLIERRDVHFLDRREYAWAAPLEHSGDPRGYTEETRDTFIRDCLLDSPMLAGVGTGPLAEGDVLTLNIRRGDFYSYAPNRPIYAMDVESYLREAVTRSVDRDGRVRRIHVVSDDIAWCRESLGFLSDHASHVTYAVPTDPPARNFLDVASSRRLVITNSTFSIWAAAVSRTVHVDNAAEIWAPAFFMSTYPPGRSYEYDADWSFVDDLPGGWQPAWLTGDARVE